MEHNFFQGLTQIFYIFRDAVNITQDRGLVGILNNDNLIFRAKFTNSIGHKCWTTSHLYFQQHLPILIIAYI